MNLERAKTEALKILGPGEYQFVKKGGERLIVKDGVLVGAGSGWLQALRKAAKPVLIAHQEAEQKARDEELAHMKAKYAEFEKYLAEKEKAELSAEQQPIAP